MGTSWYWFYNNTGSTSCPLNLQLKCLLLVLTSFAESLEEKAIHFTEETHRDITHSNVASVALSPSLRSFLARVPAARSFSRHGHRVKNTLLSSLEPPTSHSGFLNRSLLRSSTESGRSSVIPTGQPSKTAQFRFFSFYQHCRLLILPGPMPPTGSLSKPPGLPKCPQFLSPTHNNKPSPLLTQDHGIPAPSPAFGQSRC